MTARELFRQCRRRLEAAKIDSPDFDSLQLLSHFLGFDRAALALRGGEEVPPEKEAVLFHALGERENRRPLQYILGEWEFMGLSLKVGEGVLIPREDTAVLVEAALSRLREQKAPRGVDLCAGTGAVALGLCQSLPQAWVTCVELSEKAFSFLEENTRRYPQCRVACQRGNVLEVPRGFSLGSLDFLVSNPPYIAEGELPGLQEEVQKEPALALNGGADGLTFYRAIAKLWLPLLKPGGCFALEIGETQAEAVTAIFAAQGGTDLLVHKDLAGLNRAVSGRL